MAYWKCAECGREITAAHNIATIVAECPSCKTKYKITELDLSYWPPVFITKCLKDKYAFFELLEQPPFHPEFVLKQSFLKVVEMLRRWKNLSITKRNPLLCVIFSFFPPYWFYWLYKTSKDLIAFNMQDSSALLWLFGFLIPPINFYIAWKYSLALQRAKETKTFTLPRVTLGKFCIPMIKEREVEGKETAFLLLLLFIFLPFLFVYIVQRDINRIADKCAELQKKGKIDEEKVRMLALVFLHLPLEEVMIAPKREARRVKKEIRSILEQLATSWAKEAWK